VCSTVVGEMGAGWNGINWTTKLMFISVFIYGDQGTGDKMYPA